MTRATPDKNSYLRSLSPHQCKVHCRQLQSVSPQTPRQSLLLDFPAELSIYIYELALIDNDTIDISIERINTRAQSKAKKTKWPLLGTRMRPEPPLLWTCQQIRKTAIQIYYGRNTFTSLKPFGSEIVRHWLVSLVPTKQQMLRKVLVQRSSPWVSRVTGALVTWILFLERFEKELTEQGVLFSSNVLRDSHQAFTASELVATLHADGLRWYYEARKRYHSADMRRTVRRNPRRNPRRNRGSTGAS